MPKEFFITFAALIFILVTSGLIISSSKFKNYKRNRTKKRAGYQTIIEYEDIEGKARRAKAYQERESLRKARLEAKRKERAATKIAAAVRGRNSRKEIIIQKITSIDKEVQESLLEVGSKPTESLSKLKDALEALKTLQLNYGDFSKFKDTDIKDISKTMENIEEAISLISKMVAIENPENTYAELKKKRKEIQKLKNEVQEKLGGLGERWNKFRAEMLTVLTDKMKTFVDNLYESIIKGSVSDFTKGNQKGSLKALADAKKALKLYNIKESQPAYARKKLESVQKAIEIIEKYSKVFSIVSEESLTRRKIIEVIKLWEGVRDIAYAASSEHDRLFTGTEWGNFDQIFSQKLNDEYEKIKDHEDPGED